MKRIYPTVNFIITNQPNGTHHLIAVSQNDMHASMLANSLGEHIELSYTYTRPDLFAIITVRLLDPDVYFEQPVEITNETKQWLNWIDEKKVTEIWIGYPDREGKVVPYGLSKPLLIHRVR